MENTEEMVVCPSCGNRVWWFNRCVNCDTPTCQYCMGNKDAESGDGVLCVACLPIVNQMHREQHHL